MDSTIRPSAGAVPPSGPGALTSPNPTAVRGQRPLSGLPATVPPRVGERPRDADRDIGRAPLRGPGDLLSEGLGRVELPPPLELMAALEAAERHAPVADRAVPGLGRLIGAVIADERFKLARMMDLGR